MADLGAQKAQITTHNSKFNEDIDFIIGMPPISPTEHDEFGKGPRTDAHVKNAMPLVHIQPGVPNFTSGYDLMTREPAFIRGYSSQHTDADMKRVSSRQSYVDLLKDLGFNLKQGHPSISNHLTCAFLADSFPTDTFTNEYGENWLQKITNIGGEGLHGLSQMMGGRTATEMAQKLAEASKDAGKKVGGVLGDLITGAANMAERAKAGLGGMVETLPEGSTLRKLLGQVDILAAGGRIDFPMLWKNSTYQPSYTMTIRLYNPNPSSQRTTAKYIIGPIAALLLLGLPQSVGSGVYSWPFIHKFWAPGIYSIDPGYIASVTVVKGGDQQQISWKQRMGVVDVRIDFGSVFNSILSGAAASRTRPTLAGYLNAMADEKEGVVGLTDLERVNNEENQSPALLETTKNLAGGGGLTNQQIKDYQKNLATQRADQSTTQAKTQLDITEPGETIQARVSNDLKEITDNLIDLIPAGVRISF
ncbi:MAG: hypothetical protein U9P00_02965 [Pseudomonadota bacterium]|nr:hypothetical protein [Pseudomonadota bacterium]